MAIEKRQAESVSASQLVAPLELATRHVSVHVRHIEGFGQEGMLITSPFKPMPDPVPVRVHSSCAFSETFGSLDCDCASQLDAAMKVVADEGGVLVYLFEEGRGAGLALKIEAIRYQFETGVDTAAAFEKIGLVPDLRTHELAAEALKSVCGDRPVELLTNNPRKVDALRTNGLNIASRRGWIFATNDLVTRYLAEKGDVLGHYIERDQLQSCSVQDKA